MGAGSSFPTRAGSRIRLEVERGVEQDELAGVGQDELTGVGQDELAGEPARRIEHRCGFSLMGWAGSVCADTYSNMYSIFVLLIFLWILLRYVFAAYLPRIGIRYISDT